VRHPLDPCRPRFYVVRMRARRLRTFLLSGRRRRSHANSHRIARFRALAEFRLPGPDSHPGHYTSLPYYPTPSSSPSSELLTSRSCSDLPPTTAPLCREPPCRCSKRGRRNGIEPMRRAISPAKRGCSRAIRAHVHLNPPNFLEALAQSCGHAIDHGAAHQGIPRAASARNPFRS